MKKDSSFTGRQGEIVSWLGRRNFSASSRQCLYSSDIKEVLPDLNIKIKTKVRIRQFSLSGRISSKLQTHKNDFIVCYSRENMNLYSMDLDKRRGLRNTCFICSEKPSQVYVGLVGNKGEKLMHFYPMHQNEVGSRNKVSSTGSYFWTNVGPEHNECVIPRCVSRSHLREEGSSITK